MENFVLYDEIGRGEQSIVYKGRKKGTIEYVAIHCVEKAKRRELQNYVRICHELDHENIVRFFEWYETTNHLWLVVELCTGENLDNILSQDSYLPENTIQCFGKDVVEALFYLHSNDILYCDLTPSNVILDGTGTLKFSNFTLARIEGEPDFFADNDVENNESETRTSATRLPLGSPLYMAPEILQGGPYTKASDMWCFGCLLYEMFTGSPPFKASSFQSLLEQIFNSEIPYPVQGKDGTFIKASESLFMLIQGLLQKEPFKRIDWLELCMHTFWEGCLNHLVDLIEENDHVSRSEHENRYLDHASSFAEISEMKMGHPEVLQITSELKIDTNNESKLFTKSMSIREEEASQQIPPEEKKGFKGTYKLERGLAVLDLTLVGNSTIDGENKEVKSRKETYSKSRESKKIPESVTLLSIDKENLTDDSLNITIPKDETSDQPHLGPDLNVIDLLYHPADMVVSPIADNNRIQKVPVIKWDPHAIPFTPVKSENISTLSKQDIDIHANTILEFFSQINNGASNAVQQRHKLHVLGYLCNICRNEEVANSLIEKNVVKLVLVELKSPCSLEVKCRIGRLLGVLASSATFISANFNMSEVFTVITEVIRVNFRNTHLKQALLPALGEFLFYAATQEEGEDKRIPGWDPSGAIFTMITRCLQQGEDAVVQHLAAKIIENVATTTGRHCKKFLTNAVGQGLWNLFSHAVADAQKVTSCSALCRLSIHSPLIFQHVVDRAGFEIVSKSLYTGTHRIQQSLLTMFISLLSSPTHSKKITQNAAFIQKVIHLLESPALVLRGKAYLFVADIVVRSSEALLHCCQSRLVTYIERDNRKLSAHPKAEAQALSYVTHCLSLAIYNILKVVPSITEGVLRALDAVSGRQHPSSSHSRQLKSSLPLLSIILHLVTSSAFRARVIDSTFLHGLSTLLEHVKSIDTGQTNINAGATGCTAEDVTSTVFSIIEAIAQHPLLLLEHCEIIVDGILPELGSFCTSPSGDNRILSLKLFSDISALYLEDDVVEKTRRDEKVNRSMKDLQEVIKVQFLPNIGTLLQDQDPIPAYALKLLQAYVDRNAAIVPELISNGTVAILFTLFQTHQGDLKSSVLHSIIGILSTVVGNKEINFSLLCKQGLIDYLTSAFIEVSGVLDENSSDSVSPLFLQLLDTLHHVFKNIEIAVKSVMHSKRESKVSSSAQDVEALLRDCKVLCELNGVLITLLCFEDDDIQEWSCRCLYLSAELFGGEYEDCFADENLESLTEAIQSSSHKKKKLLLRVVKRFVTSNPTLLEVLRSNGELLLNCIKELGSIPVTDSDSKIVQTIATELVRLLA